MWDPYISAAVAWEIAIKRSLGKLDAPDDLETAMVAAEGALAEARKQIEREASRSAAAEQRNRELSERVIAEAAKAQAFAAGVEQLGGSRR